MGSLHRGTEEKSDPWESGCMQTSLGVWGLENTMVENFPESLTSLKKKSMKQVCAAWLPTTRDIEDIKYFSISVTEWHGQDHL